MRNISESSKGLLLSTILSLLSFYLLGNVTATSDSTGVLVDKIIARVGGELILWSEIEEQVAILQQRKQDLGENTHCAVIQNSLVQKLLLNQARLDSVIITDDEIDTQLDARIDQILGMMNNDIDYFEDYYGMTLEEVRSQFRRDLEEKLLTERMQSQIVGNVSITPSEVKDFFSKIPKDSLPYFNSEVEYREIVVKPTPSKASQNAIIDILEGLKREILDGASFEELASTYSEDPGSAANGGDLGWQKRGTFVPEFEAAVFNLQPYELSPIIKSPFGYHLIQLIERRGNTVNARHILMSAEVLDEDIERSLNFLDSVRTEILLDSMTFEYAVTRYSEESETSATNGGRVVNPKSGNTFFEIDHLEPDIFFTLDTLEVNDISKPFVDRNRRGERILRFIQLLSRTDPHQANLNTDYNKIATAAKEQKKSKLLNDWMMERMSQTYIKIDDRYLKCPNLKTWLVSDLE